MSLVCPSLASLGAMRNNWHASVRVKPKLKIGIGQVSTVVNVWYENCVKKAICPGIRASGCLRSHFVCAVFWEFGAKCT